VAERSEHDTGESQLPHRNLLKGVEFGIRRASERFMTQQEAEQEAQQISDALITGEGFACLKDVIDADLAAALRATMLERLDSATKVGKGVLRLGQLLEWGDAFTSLATNPRLLAIAHKLLGPDATLAAFSGRVLMPGCEMGAIHVDWPYWAMNPGMPANPPLMMQVIWMMEPFNETNGGTLVAPGSQNWGQNIDPQRFQDNSIHATGAAGDAIVSHGLMWHRTALNRAEQPRVAVLINYTQLTVRPMATLGPFSDEFRESVSPELATLLGFDYASSIRQRAPGTR
jgi:ectoine hydroxylase-related dioxygenase (phytanoyl-CoA dioxygenase family)